MNTGVGAVINVIQASESGKAATSSDLRIILTFRRVISVSLYKETNLLGM